MKTISLAVLLLLPSFLNALAVGLPTDGQVAAAAAKVDAIMASPEMQAAQVSAYARILKDVPVSVPQPGALDKLFAQVGQPLFPPVNPPEELMVLVSFSMPQEALKNLAQQADKAGAVLVLRGMVGDSLDKTAKAIQSVLGDTASDSTFQVNPTVFRAYHVQDVPTFVIARKPANTASEGQGSCELGTDYASVRGDVSLDYALRKLADQGSFKAAANRYLTAMGVEP